MSIYADPRSPIPFRYADVLTAAAAAYDGDLVARHAPGGGPGAPGPHDPGALLELAPPAAYVSALPAGTLVDTRYRAPGLPDVEAWADNEPVVNVADPRAGQDWAGDPADPVTTWDAIGDNGSCTWEHMATDLPDAATCGRAAASIMATLAGAR